MTDGEVAIKMLRDNGIYDVKVTFVVGFLSDHYNPLNKTVNFSLEVYSGSNISSAAHECGHALQHAVAYPWIMMRSKLVSVAGASSFLMYWILLSAL